MSYNPKKHHRRSIRLRGWNYASAAGYFVTIVVKHRRRFFGKVVEGEMHLSALGLAADECWREIPSHHDGVGLDAFVIMPDHVHGIVLIDGSQDLRRGALVKGVQLNTLTGRGDAQMDGTDRGDAHTDATGRGDAQLNTRTRSGEAQSDLISPAKGSLSVIIRTYKAAVTTWARRNKYEEFGWLGRFYEHIIRNERDLERIRKYIADNPRKWKGVSM